MAIGQTRVKDKSTFLIIPYCLSETERLKWINLQGRQVGPPIAIATHETVGYKEKQTVRFFANPSLVATALAAAACLFVTIRPVVATSPSFPGQTGDFHGFISHTFTVDGCNAIVAEPKTAATGTAVGLADNVLGCLPELRHRHAGQGLITLPASTSATRSPLRIPSSTFDYVL